MRVGVVPQLHKTSGGVYQYSETMLRALQRMPFIESGVVFLPEGDTCPPGLLTNPTWQAVELPAASGAAGARLSLSRVARGIGRRLARAAAPQPRTDDLDSVHADPELAAWFAGFGVDLMIFTTPHELCFKLGIPYVVAVHDLQHRLQPEFPEVSADGEWERREYQNRNSIRHATLVLTDSEEGAGDVLRFYGEFGVTREHVAVLPFLPAGYLAEEPSRDEIERVRRKYELTGDYFFYPAQFWPHKNHLRLVEALREVKADPPPKLVLSGSASGELMQETLTRMGETAAALGVSERLQYLGYVPDEDMSGLYAGALALVMPTFFGPTNIPVLEAFRLGCPVITSDISGIREQVGDAALLVDPRSAKSIAEAMQRILDEPVLSDLLRQRGRERMAAYTEDDYQELLSNHLVRAARLAGIGPAEGLPGEGGSIEPTTDTGGTR